MTFLEGSHTKFCWPHTPPNFTQSVKILPFFGGSPYSMSNAHAPAQRQWKFASTSIIHVNHQYLRCTSTWYLIAAPRTSHWRWKFAATSTSPHFLVFFLQTPLSACDFWLVRWSVIKVLVLVGRVIFQPKFNHWL